MELAWHAKGGIWEKRRRTGWGAGLGCKGMNWSFDEPELGSSGREGEEKFWEGKHGFLLNCARVGSA